jgi:hypothetical protein
MKLRAPSVRSLPMGSKDCGMARRCKLVLGAEFERGAVVQEYLFVGPLRERAKSSHRQTCKLSVTRLRKGTVHQGYANSDALRRVGKRKV